ncbi:MAG: KamA family radical SAM protein, partial [Candidatus Latescibacterota bacterium]
TEMQYLSGSPGCHDSRYVLTRDAARAARSLFAARSEELAGFSVTRTLWDVARGGERADLSPAFCADVHQLLRGLQGEAEFSQVPGAAPAPSALEGRQAALARSGELDALWERVAGCMARFASGLTREAVERRAQRRARVLGALGGTEADWGDWTWQVGHVLRDADTVARVVPLTAEEEDGVRRAGATGLPFGITPYYAGLMDADPAAGRDAAIRRQVLPDAGYVTDLVAGRADSGATLDFMREQDTSPVDLVTRRYPAVAILKPFNTCPQICVYCQRNWEIDTPMAADALAPWERIEAACAWIEAHPAIREVLVTGGDPLALPDAHLGRILERIARIDTVDLIRIGSRVPVTLPMRVTLELAELLGGLREPGVREVCVVTHVEHVYEVTPDLVRAVERLRREGIGVYNQLVYTFFVSRRFEAAALRLLLRRCGVDPYYTFVPKGKEETRAYRVPVARLLQERKEEARLLPGSRRTDEPVYNLPGLGKNYLRAVQHRDLLAIRP